jgi:hypothetical protein
MEQVMSDATGARRFSMALLVFFAGAALLLTVMGIYGVVSFMVGRRRREIGVRVALGARRVDVLRLVLQQGMKPVVAGGVAGLMGSLAVSRLIASQLFGVSSTDPLTLMSIAALLGAAALLASWLPARRADAWTWWRRFAMSNCIENRELGIAKCPVIEGESSGPEAFSPISQPHIFSLHFNAQSITAMNDLKFAFRQLLKDPGPPPWPCPRSRSASGDNGHLQPHQRRVVGAAAL